MDRGMVAVSEVLRRVMAVFLLLAGAAVWAFSTWAGAGVLAAEVGHGEGRFSRYYGSPWPAEVQLNSDVFDVQVGALLVSGCAVAVLLCRSVRGLGDVLDVLVTLPCALLVVNAVLARVVGSSLTAAVTGGLVLVGLRRVRVRSEFAVHAKPARGRRVLGRAVAAARVDDVRSGRGAGIGVA